MKLNYIQRFYTDVSVGAKLVLDSGGAVKSMKEFKQEIKDAKAELLNVQAAFGATSKEALEAAKKVAMLEDSIRDASETTKLFDPGNKFQVLGNAVRGLVGGFTALQGALALAGVEGEDLQKTLLKVQGALALTEGLNVVADVTKDFQRLGAVLTQTFGKAGVMGIAIAGVTALGLALSGVFDKKERLSVTAYNDSLKEFNKTAAESRQKIVEVQVALEQARAKVITKEQALKVYNDTLGDSLGKTNSLTQAEKILAEKAEAYIQITALKAQANALFAKSAESSANALLMQQKLADANLSTKGFVGSLVDKINSEIKTTLEESKKMDELAAGLLRKAGALSSQFNINTGAPIQNPTSKPPRVEAAEQEAESIKAIEEDLLAKRTTYAEQTKDLYNSLNETLKTSNKSVADDYIANQQRQAEAAQAQRDLELSMAQDRIAVSKDIGRALGALSELIGKQTAAGKALAIAQAVINTWVGVTEVLRAKSTLPEPFATISKIANVTAIVATGLSAVKNIVKQQVPGGGGGGGVNAGSLQSAAPLQPRAPQATNTVLNADQLNQIGNATVRAFVVESDVSSGQERIRRLNRAARI